MEVIETPIKDLLILKPRVYEDIRGFFYESYNQKTFCDLGLNVHFCQDNQSKSVYGVIRGLHYQLKPYSQTKLVSVIQGKIWDIAVDLRKDSPDFGRWYGIELSLENHLHFLVPKGFAHGFSVLSETAIFSYKCDDYYQPAFERGIAFDDPNLKIDWKVPMEKAIISEKDKTHSEFKLAEMNF